MGSIGRYFFRTGLGAHATNCVGVTALTWITHALRDVERMTDQGQRVFVGVIATMVPRLVESLAPIVPMVNVTRVLDRLMARSPAATMLPGVATGMIALPFQGDG